MGLGIAHLQPSNVTFENDENKVNTILGWYELVLKNHINRILILACVGNDEDFIKGVRLLDAYLISERDSIYEQEINELKRSIYLKDISTPYIIKEESDYEKKILVEYSIGLFEILMKLMKRKGMTPRTQVIDKI